MSHGSDGRCDHGDALPDGFSPGSREWSGSAVLHSDRNTVSLYFTAAGRREGRPYFEQRLFGTRGQLIRSGDAASIRDWSLPRELFAADGIFYAPAREQVPTSGMILGFRDPGYFRDPADGRDYILFTGSAADAGDAHDGVIGVARRDGDVWTPLPPLVEAFGVAKELERPHIIARDGRYHLFWSTQASRFAPGDFRANRSLWNVRRPHRRFGGAIAPTARLRLDGDRAAIVAPVRSNRARSA